MNELDPNLQFIFEKLTTNINFLDINLKKVNNNYILISTTNLQTTLVIFAIKCVTHCTRKTILHCQYPDAL